MGIIALSELKRRGFTATRVGSRCSSFNNLTQNSHIFDRKGKNNALTVEKLTIFAA